MEKSYWVFNRGNQIDANLWVGFGNIYNAINIKRFRVKEQYYSHVVVNKTEVTIRLLFLTDFNQVSAACQMVKRVVVQQWPLVDRQCIAP